MAVRVGWTLEMRRRAPVSDFDLFDIEPRLELTALVYFEIRRRQECMNASVDVVNVR